MIKDNQRLVGAKDKWKYDIPVYDDGFGPIFIHRDSMGIMGIIRALTWEDAYSISEDEFFPEAGETVEELVKEYGFRREHKKVVKSGPPDGFSEIWKPDCLKPGEKFAGPEDYADNGKLPEWKFIRWQLIETPDRDAWMDNELFQEAYGFRPNGPRAGVWEKTGEPKDPIGHGIYAKDLNGDWLEQMTPGDKEEITLIIEDEK